MALRAHQMRNRSTKGIAYHHIPEQPAVKAGLATSVAPIENPL
jgi:hypothetical protein